MTGKPEGNESRPCQIVFVWTLMEEDRALAEGWCDLNRAGETKEGEDYLRKIIGQETYEEMDRAIEMAVEKAGRDTDPQATQEAAPSQDRLDIRTCEHYIRKYFQMKDARYRVAHEMGVTPEGLSRRYKAITGHTFSSQLRRFRMTTARHHLMMTNRSVESIGTEVGYRSLSSFSEAFKKYFGLSPQMYRRQHHIGDS
ncbi:MAG: helix-turn-helix transcriptional regulator [Lachnospiraceae bacterium]|nr:helix-turn-helix transcriptional regulator [Lachnospiraceae bacterium]